jgi:hypothetical protein
LIINLYGFKINTFKTHKQEIDQKENNGGTINIVRQFQTQSSWMMSAMIAFRNSKMAAVYFIKKISHLFYADKIFKVILWLKLKIT